jgi:nucleotide-binding universal stress UspA family protein
MILDDAKNVTGSETQNDPRLPVALEHSVFRRILVAVDFSEASHRALIGAMAITAGEAAEISVVHVSDMDWRYEMLENPPEINLERIDAGQQLSAWIGDLASPRKFETITVNRGPVARAVLAVAGEKQPDLLVIGTRGRRALSKVALGSVAEELLRSAACPVLTIGPQADLGTDRGPGFPTILFATDFGKGSTNAMPMVLALARERQSKLILLHMISTMPAASSNLCAYAPVSDVAHEFHAWQDSAQKRALRELQEWLPLETGLKQLPEYVVGTSFLEEGILAAAAKYRADLIVMGAIRRHSARLAAHFPWSAVHEVVCSARCPVLTAAG